MASGQEGSFDQAAARSLEGRVWALLEQGKTTEAIDACEQLNRQFPDFASGWHTASRLALKLNNPAMALATVNMALRYEPDSTAWAILKAQCLGRLGEMQQLAAMVEQLSLRKLQDAYQLSAVAMLQTQLGRRDAALELYRKAIELEPKQAVHYYNVACMQRSLGQLEAAEANYDQAIRLNPADYESCKIRSDLRRQTSERNHVEELEALLERGIEDDRGLVQVRFALAKELEDLGEWQRSFEHLKAGAEHRRKRMQYDAGRELETVDAISNAFGSDIFAAAEPGCDSGEAIFILGMPRTGTTLVERILASHSDVFAAGELNNFAAQLMTMLRATNRNKRPSRVDLVQASTRLDFKGLGEAYVKSTRPFTGHTPRFIDKMPLNFLYVGLIRLALPNATIISLQRDPMDTCYAIYKQLFVDAYPFSYDLEELANYYVAYHQLMAHWNKVLPGVIHSVQYEALVADPETESRRLVAACGLDWQPRCLKFYENPDASTTASTAQVRQPVYQSSVGKWRYFREQLQPVADILRQAGISVPE